MGQTISFKRPDGQSVQGYLAEPGGGSGPGVVVIQEWWGLNGQIKGVADRMAAAGYRALVPDLYRGKVTVEASRQMAGEASEAVARRTRTPPDSLGGTRRSRGTVRTPGACIGDAPADVVDTLVLWP